MGASLVPPHLVQALSLPSQGLDHCLKAPWPFPALCRLEGELNPLRQEGALQGQAEWGPRPPSFSGPGGAGLVMDRERPGSSAGKESACSAGDPGSIPGSGGSPEEHGEHSSILAWRISWTEEPGGLQGWDMTERLTTASRGHWPVGTPADPDLGASVRTLPRRSHTRPSSFLDSLHAVLWLRPSSCRGAGHPQDA